MRRKEKFWEIRDAASHLMGAFKNDLTGDELAKKKLKELKKRFPKDKFDLILK